MSAKQTKSGPAFPVEAPHSFNAGMSLRDYFAASALPAIVRAHDIAIVSGQIDQAEFSVMARCAYALAEYMLSERAK